MRPRHLGLPRTLNTSYRVFDRHVKTLQKERAATQNEGANSRKVDYLRKEVAERMLERFQDIRREFRDVLDLGGGCGHLAKLLPSKHNASVTLFDSCLANLWRDPPSDFEIPVSRIHGDEEYLLRSFKIESFDAIVSCLSLHWVNDLPGTLVQVRECLKPDGVFLGAMIGGDTLFELRTALQVAELDREGGVSPHISPMTGSHDISNLLDRAGFRLLTVDIDEIKVVYPTIWELMSDLRDMGESNAVSGRRTHLYRDTILAASAAYRALHGDETGVPATFQIVFMVGWKPGD